MAKAKPVSRIESDRLNTPTDLDPNDTKKIAEGLTVLLSDLFALYIKTKNFHWHVSGPNFRDYHLLMDEQSQQIFSIIDGYHAGVCRTAVVGEPSSDAERVYRNLVDCKHLVLDALRPGVAARDIYGLFRAKFDELGMPPISFVGHGIGVSLHESPYLGPYSDRRIEAGMVFGVEPLVYRSGYGFGMQIKDMVAIEPAGARLLSDVSDTDVLCRIEA